MMCAERIDYELFGHNTARTEPVDITYDLICGESVFAGRVAQCIIDVSTWMDNMDRVPGVRYRVTKVESARDCVQS